MKELSLHPSTEQQMLHQSIAIERQLQMTIITKFTKNEALAAVIVPYGLTKAAFSLLICSGVEGRIPLSLVTGFDFPARCMY